MKHKREKQWMCKENKGESVLEEVWWVVRIIREAEVVGVRVWIMTTMNSKAPPRDLHSGVLFSDSKPAVNIMHNNITLLTRDLLYVVELVDAIATGDFGWIKDILPTLACMF